MPQYADKSDTLAGFVLAQTEHGLFLYLIARAVGFCTVFCQIARERFVKEGGLGGRL